MDEAQSKTLVQKQVRKAKWTDYARFLIPSFVGVLLFIVPIPYKGGITVPVALLASLLGNALELYLPIIAVLIMGVAFAGSACVKLTGSSRLQSPYINALFKVTWPFFIARGIGFLFALLSLLQIGPEFIYSDSTGGFLLTGLIPVLLATFVFAGLFLPLLLDFGLLDLCGVLFAKIMRPVFTLPGRSSMDCIASWLGDGTIGVFLTSKQYEEGYYTEREAAVISTTFSVVSITFSIVVITQLGLAHMFFPYYVTIVLTGIVLAVVMPRIPPLSRKKEKRIKEINYDEAQESSDEPPLKRGVSKAIAQAQKNSSFAVFARNGFRNVFDMWIGVIPVVMAVGTVSLIIAEYTPIFTWLGMPLVPILTLLQIPEATAASAAILVGFADMFLPALLSGGIESEMTRFIIACLSVSQLVYMSEVGGLILGSRLPISFKDLVLIFLLRTAISLPIITAIAHFLF